MKTLRRAFFLALAAVCLFPLLASGAPPQRNYRPYTPPAYMREKIIRFQSYVQVHPDATLTVTETIKVESARVVIKRGIVRDFPTIYKKKTGETVKVGFEVLEVLRDGKEEPYHLEHVSNGVKIYIGQKDVILPAGKYEYTIKYYTDRQLGFFKDYDELYWNATGHKWTFPINHAEAVIELPPGAKIIQHSAYTGPMGVRGRDFQVREAGPGKIIFSTTRGLPPGSGLTVAVAWPKGVVQEPSDTDKMGFFLRDHLPAIVGLMGLFLVLGFYLVSWVRVGRDPEEGTIIPLFAPPPGFSPPSVRFLMRMGFDDRTVATALVDMAVKGYLTIENIGKEYTLRKRGGGVKSLSRGEQNLGGKLFAGGDTLEMKNRNHELIQDARDALQKTLKGELEKAYFVGNANYFVTGLILSVLAVGAVILASMNHGGAGETFLRLLLWTGACVALATWAFHLWGGMSASGAFSFVRKLSAAGMILFGFGFLTIRILSSSFIKHNFSLALVVLLAVLMGVNFLFYRLLKSPTLSGRKVMDQIEGFKLYLSVAEKERLNLLNPPEKTPELFEKYLPYALALDVENEWSEQFADVLAAAGEGRGYTPGWYTGSYHDVGSSRFVSNLGGAFAGAISSSASPPGSSSGSGGGGFSGGGGGGGGGSGW